MSFKTSVRLDAPIFNKSARRQALSSVVSKAAKEFKSATKRRMIESIAAGATYEKRSGQSFTRSHRASRRGQRPALETGNLVNAVTDRRTSEYSAEVFIAHQPNPETGAYADEYAEKLQAEMDRKIMVQEDISEANKKLTDDCEIAITKLL